MEEDGIVDRKKELIEYCCKKGNETLIEPLVDQLLFLETKLEELKKLPFIKVNPNNPNQQKSTPAQKQYKELLQQYTNVVKVLSSASGHEQEDPESPLRKYYAQKLETR